MLNKLTVINYLKIKQQKRFYLLLKTFSKIYLRNILEYIHFVIVYNLTIDIIGEIRNTAKTIIIKNRRCNNIMSHTYRRVNKSTNKKH